ncbi:zwei Ig domain protein zig-8-like isoform X2 [Mercenaria mercenaria]|uniref:zwei Ig domain protein zig-8-like isoform X2 n=1 Tax=Mercenaria mercenaria TaxID=6596 RepID=UPI00234EDBB7|nr:zwei Ig domain protein zig-8-like isoform X2 [Mercenaria mercenaria]
MFPSNYLGESIPLYSTFVTLIYVFLCLMSAIAYDYESPTYFIPQPHNVTFHIGQTATLLCSVENLGNKTVVWRKASNPHPIAIGEFIYAPDKRYSVQISKERREYNLQIHNIRQEDSGVYHCQISTKEKLIRHILLTVEEGDMIPPYIMPEIVLSGNEYVNAGDTIRLVCNVTGNTDIPQDVDWFRDGILLRPFSSPKIHIRKDTSITRRKLDSVLEIHNSNLDDDGLYICRNSETLIASLKVNILNEIKSNTGKRGTAGDAKSGQICNRQWWTLFFSVFLTTVVTKAFIYLS